MNRPLQPTHWVLAVALAALSLAQPARAETVTVYRDTFGVPHIYADTAEAGLYADGWTQAEDRLGEILKNFLRGMGEYSASFGPGQNDADYRADQESRMWDHYGTAQKNLARLRPAFRRHLAAFVAGINDYMKAHPDEVPAWWGRRAADVYMPVAFSRQYIWSWPAGQASEDLKKIGLTPTYDVDFRSSNEWAVAPSRSAVGAPILIIDPHLAWFGRQRYWEIRLHAGDLHISGFATAGFPYVSLGHNENVAWAHTTGGPDTADVYELTLNPNNPLEYVYDGAMRKLTTRTVKIQIKGEPQPREVTFYFSHHGPIVARKGGKAYAAKLAYADEVGYLQSRYLLAVAKDYRGVIAATDERQIMPQNVMAADTAGNIYYQRTGRVPIRAGGLDCSRPLDGSTSKTEWLGLHPTADLIQVLNPPQGYMQNCNCPPDVMMVDSPMQADRYKPYLFNQRHHWTHQRAARAVQLLHGDNSVTPDEAQAYALDPHCYQYDRWVKELLRADTRDHGERSSNYVEGLKDIVAWDGYSRRDSRGALKYYYWRRSLAEKAGPEKLDRMIAKVNNYVELFGWEPRTPQPLTSDEQTLLVVALWKGMNQMRTNHGSLDAAFGDVFRVGRLDSNDNVSYPVGGGTLIPEGMYTPRAIGFGPQRPDHTRWGERGQTSTEVVILTKPIQSFTQPPIGQSDHPGSPHYRDQAEKLFSPAKMKPSHFHKPDLLAGHVERKYELEYPGSR